tara:strand:+ start:1101 stop:1793 length:693 start_codon:yes stop_codon:yes gene_type:complete
MANGGNTGPGLGMMQGLIGTVTGGVGLRKANKELRESQMEYNRRMRDYQAQDTSNLYANMENVMEDITVNTQAADMANQQQQQALANTMQNLSGAAGGSGIAAVAQAMAGQQSQNLQAASASIGQQERANQIATAQQAGALQEAERAGAGQARALRADKQDTLLGMAQGRLGQAKEVRAGAMGQMLGGIADIGLGVYEAQQNTQTAEDRQTGGAGGANPMLALMGQQQMG